MERHDVVDRLKKLAHHMRESDAVDPDVRNALIVLNALIHSLTCRQCCVEGMARQARKFEAEFCSSVRDCRAADER